MKTLVDCLSAACARWNQTKLGPRATCGVLAVALAILPCPWAASSAAFDEAENAAGREAPTFELHVVGPDGKPVRLAHVEIRTDPKLTAEQILTGNFVKEGPYGTFVTTDEAGRLRLRRPRAPRHFSINITTAGYGPYWAGWSSETHPEPIPAQLTAELEAGWSVGGIIRSDDGKPVEGVPVRPRIEFKKRPGDVLAVSTLQPPACGAFVWLSRFSPARGR